MSLAASPHLLTSPMACLVAELDEITATVPEVARPPAVAAALSDHLGCANLLGPQHLRSSSTRYRTNLVHVADAGAYSVVALVWRPGQRTPIHSHRSWCVVGVHEGSEVERSFSWSDGRLVERGAQRYDVGAITWMTEGDDDVHEVVASTAAVSIHVYGLDYRTTASSIRTTFAPSLTMAA
jgi:predicted metal-dependent enzyme (double-stranded beta helix superfamily)